MRSFANFDTLDNMRIRPGYTSAGFTGEYLLRFKNTSEGFLEAIHLDLLLRAQSGKVDGKSGEVALEGKLALAKDCHRGWDLKKNGLSIRKFRASVLAPVQHSEAKLKQILHENGQASAENAELSSALMDSTQELCALSDKAEERMNHFKEMVEKLNAELISNKRLKEEHDRENQQKFEQQQARFVRVCAPVCPVIASHPLVDRHKQLPLPCKSPVVVRAEFPSYIPSIATCFRAMMFCKARRRKWCRLCSR